MTRVKICGITSLQDARVAVESGADMLGFVFFAKSPRFVPPETVGEITSQLQAPVQYVGVFVNEAVERVRQVASAAHLDLVQLHGYESPSEMRALAPHGYKALRPRNLEEALVLVEQFRESVASSVPQFVIDAYEVGRFGGTGTRGDWEIAQRIASGHRILLAGGLDPENVQEAIRQVQPWGVDVSSGVERAPGLKDHRLVCQFVKRAKKG